MPKSHSWDWGRRKRAHNVVLKYYRPDFECFSAWDSVELKAFSNFLMKLKFAEWKDIYATAGKAGTKKGFGYTPHKDRKRLPDDPELSDISPDIKGVQVPSDSISEMSAEDCQNLLNRIEKLPAYVDTEQSEQVNLMRDELDGRLDNLQVEGLLARFRQMSEPLRKQFLEMATTEFKS